MDNEEIKETQATDALENGLQPEPLEQAQNLFGIYEGNYLLAPPPLKIRGTREVPVLPFNSKEEIDIALFSVQQDCMKASGVLNSVGNLVLALMDDLAVFEFDLYLQKMGIKVGFIDSFFSDYKSVAKERRLFFPNGEPREGVIALDHRTGLLDVIFTNDRLGGLHCGDQLEVFMNGGWIPVSVKLHEGKWCLSGLSEYRERFPVAVNLYQAFKNIEGARAKVS
ncbi:MAG: DUF5348 domain-containing protein [Clostridiales bacterium]|jgi:hypothetical protein|nr:DUF5348 domain-containing protein [Clostridiales bacterium]MDR2752445.1 DUF5348 domain-containing protein [Clostridiales bacterium]